MVKIAVTFELGAECLLTVTARELNTGREVQAVMSASEGAAVARRKLEQDTDAARAQTDELGKLDPAALLAGAAAAAQPDIVGAKPAPASRPRWELFREDLRAGSEAR